MEKKFVYSIRCLMGSQCRCLRTGVMCILPGVLVTRRAAWFWIFWSLLIWYSGRPNRRLFPMSSLDVMNACTSCSVAFSERNGRILEMFHRWKWADEQMELIWVTMLMLGSSSMPKFLTMEERLIETSPIEMLSMVTFLSWWKEPNSIISVLSSFNLRKFALIHWRISAMHRAIRSRSSATLSWVGLVAKYNWVSSA